MTIRIAIAVLLKTLGICCFAFVAFSIANAAHEYATIPSVQYKDSSLSWPVLIIPTFCGLVFLAVAQRIRAIYPPSDLDER